MDAPAMNDYFEAAALSPDAKSHLDLAAFAINGDPIPDSVNGPADLAMYVRDKNGSFTARFAAMIVAANHLTGASAPERWSHVAALIDECDDIDGLAAVIAVLDESTREFEALEDPSDAATLAASILAYFHGHAEARMMHLQVDSAINGATGNDS